MGDRRLSLIKVEYINKKFLFHSIMRGEVKTEGTLNGKEPSKQEGH
jgi:hypothetical protein